MPQKDKLLLMTDRFAVWDTLIPSRGSGDNRRAIIRHPGAVAILAWIDDQRICLIKNHRAAAGSQLIELPAGTLDPHETPEQAARRELAEETGYQAGRLTPLHRFYVSPGILDEQIHLFLATRLRAGKAARQPDERIENYVVSWEEALAMAADGRICDAKTLVGLLFYERTRRTA